MRIEPRPRSCGGLVRQTFKRAAFLGVATAAFWLTSAVQAAVVHFVDVSAGLACVIESDEHRIVIDGGADPGGLAAYLKAARIEGPIDLAIVLHPSTVSFRGLDDVIRKYAVSEYWDAGWDVPPPSAASTDEDGPSFGSGDGPTHSYLAHLDLLRNKHARIVSPLSSVHPAATSTGRLEWFTIADIPGVRFCLLYARTSRSSRRSQWPCLSMLIEVDGVRYFFSGHTGGRSHAKSVAAGVEARLLDLERRMPGCLRADVMVAPWMGSSWTSSKDLIAAVRPSVAIVSGSPRFRLPSAETLDRYDTAGSRLFVTTLHSHLLRDNIQCSDNLIATSDDEDPYAEVSCHYVDATLGKDVAWRGRVGDRPLTIERVEAAAPACEKPIGGDAPSSATASKAKTSLAGADLAGLEFSGCLAGANLSGANLAFSDLSEADLTGADLSGADLSYARLDGATLVRLKADPNTLLHGVHADGANLSNSQLAGCDLSGAHLHGAVLDGVSAAAANFSFSDLTRSRLVEVNMKDAAVLGTRFDEAVWELRPGGLPSAADMSTYPHLELLTVERSPHALIELRDAFRKAGFREKQKIMTFLIQRRERLREQAGGDWIESKLKLVLFELPTKWGASAIRPLQIVASLWLVFALAYFLIMRFASRTSLRVVVSRRRRKDPSKMRVHVVPVRRIVPRKRSRRVWSSRVRFEVKTVMTALNFSFRNTLNLRFQWLDAATWIRMLQRRDFELEPLGTTRTLAGIQSLLSLYLVAMAILAYFGSPFE